MNRNLIFNLIFIAVFIISLVLSFIIDFFFFIPIICILPFTFNTIKRKNTSIEEISPEFTSYGASGKSELRHCPRCKGEITQSIAKFCYHCGLKLNTKDNVVPYG